MLKRTARLGLWGLPALFCVLAVLALVGHASAIRHPERTGHRHGVWAASLVSVLADGTVVPGVHDLRLNGNPFGPGVGTQVTGATFASLMPAGLHTPSTSLADDVTLESLWQRSWQNDDGSLHTSVVAEYASAGIRVIVKTPTEMRDPAASFKAIASQDGVPNAAETLMGFPALVSPAPAPDAYSDQLISSVQFVTGSGDEVIIQGYRSPQDLLAIATSMILPA